MKRAIIISGIVAAILLAVTVTLWFQQDGDADQKEAKPVVYLYPVEDTVVDVSLRYSGEVTMVYPAFTYDSGWTLKANRQGTIIVSGNTYRYLFWEGTKDIQYDFTESNCVSQQDLLWFLEGALEAYGLTSAEKQDFITYWYPQMQDYAYTMISFQQDWESGITVSLTPDTHIKVFMAWYPLGGYEMPISSQLFPKTLVERDGFTIVEWGGSEVKRR